MSRHDEVFARLEISLVMSIVAFTSDMWCHPAFKGSLELFEELLAADAEQT